MLIQARITIYNIMNYISPCPVRELSPLAKLCASRSPSDNLEPHIITLEADAGNSPTTKMKRRM